MPRNDPAICSTHYQALYYLPQTDLHDLCYQSVYVSRKIREFATYCQTPNIQMVADYYHGDEMNCGKRTRYKDPEDDFYVDWMGTLFVEEICGTLLSWEGELVCLIIECVQYSAAQA